MNRKLTMTIIVAACLLCIGLLAGLFVFAEPDSGILYQAGLYLKELWNPGGEQANGADGVLAKYNGEAITADNVEYNRKMNILRSPEQADKYDTDYNIIVQLVTNRMVREEAERRGLVATEEEIQSMVDNAMEAYAHPDGKEMMDEYFAGAGITLEEYLQMVRDVAPGQIARQKLLDAVGKEYCEANGLEFTKLNPPAEMVAAQEAFLKELYEQNKHKVEWFMEIQDAG